MSPAAKKPNPWWVAVVSGMASYIDAAAIIGFGTALVLYQEPLGLTPTDIGLASGILTGGIAIGALVGGRLGDRLGRRPVFTATMMLIIVATALLVFSTEPSIIVIGAVLLGLGTGADLPVSLSTISEAAADRNRGRLLAFSNSLWLAGIIGASIIGAVTAELGRLGGQILMAHVGIVAVLVLIGRLTIPESEAWRAAQDERARGIRTIRADRADLRSLIRSPYAAPFFALIVFYSLTNLAANTQGQFSSYIFVNYGGMTVSQAVLVGMPLIPFGIIAALLFIKFADSPRRFRLFTIAAVLQVVSPLVTAIFGVSYATAIIAGIIGIAGGSFAAEGMMKVWTQEQFPTLLRTSAQGIIISIGRFAAAILAAVTPLILLAGPTAFYLMLATFNLVGVGWAWVVFRKRDRLDAFTTEAEADPDVTAEPRDDARPTPVKG